MGEAAQSPSATGPAAQSAVDTAMPEEVPMSHFVHSDKAGPRKIPMARFLEDVAASLEGRDLTKSVETLNSLHQKYKFMESSLVKQQQVLIERLPDMEAAAEAVGRVKENRDAQTEFTTTYQLTDTIYANAHVAPSDSVLLWLGANTLLEYRLQDALDLLKSNRSKAEESIESIQEDLDFLREQLTTTEVNIARVHNHRVKTAKQAQQQRPEGAAKLSVGTASAGGA
eukprot:GHVU01110683.1.p1 GENE.GHVU01110683.1~~GHVU01110683.1.p1  ORF type:complete len:227 (+),score=68.94 GHVU01110683.1:483-1163(+)